MPRTPLTTADLATWFGKRLPDDWFEGLEVMTDHEEILVIGTLPEPPAEDADESDGLREARLAGAISTFRERTRGDRMGVAREAERTFRRKVSWGVRCGGVQRLFTTNTVPVMTRLRLPERRVLDTLIDAGEARSRSEAIAWCLKRVAETDAEWFGKLREAFAHVEAVRVAGPDLA